MFCVNNCNSVQCNVRVFTKINDCVLPLQAIAEESNIDRLKVIFDHLQKLKVKHSVTPEGK